MANKKEIMISIDASGKVAIETKGYKGELCKLDTKELEKALGIVDDFKPKKEYKEKQRIMSTTTQRL